MTLPLKIKKIGNIVFTLIVVLAVIFAILLLGGRLIGLQTYTVLSGSMEPTYATGSLLYVKKVNPEDVQVGQPVTFVLNEDLIVATHRVIAIDEENQYFYTKGDANHNADGEPVHFENLIGIPQFCIPYLGYVANYVQNSPGRYVVITACAVLLLWMLLPDLLFDKPKGQGKNT